MPYSPWVNNPDTRDGPLDIYWPPERYYQEACCVACGWEGEARATEDFDPAPACEECGAELCPGELWEQDDYTLDEE